MSYPEGCLEIFQNAERLAQELGDEESLIQIHGGLSLYYTSTGNPSLGLEYAEKCFNSAEKINDFRLMAQSASSFVVHTGLSVMCRKFWKSEAEQFISLKNTIWKRNSFGMGFSVYTANL